MRFGAAQLVSDFNRLARAIRAAMVRLLFYPLIQYFDGYTAVEPGVVANDGKSLLEEAMDILGWAVECKSPPNSEFVSLGAQFD